jgi:hypothetical protein
MGHCGKFIYALWATTVNLVMCYETLQRILLYIWATAADLVMGCGSLRGTKPYSKNL